MEEDVNIYDYLKSYDKNKIEGDDVLSSNLFYSNAIVNYGEVEVAF